MRTLMPESTGLVAEGFLRYQDRFYENLYAHGMQEVVIKLLLPMSSMQQVIMDDPTVSVQLVPFTQSTKPMKMIISHMIQMLAWELHLGIPLRHLRHQAPNDN